MAQLKGDVKRDYENLKLPECPSCKSAVEVKLVIHGYPSQELMTYALSPNSRVVLGECIKGNRYKCISCQYNF